MRLHHKSIQRVWSFLLTLFLLFSIQINTPDTASYASSYGNHDSRQTSMLCKDTVSLEINHCETRLIEHVKRCFLSKNQTNLSLKSLRFLSIACMMACLFFMEQFRRTWTSHKATTRSQKLIIQYIHNKDGQKA